MSPILLVFLIFLFTFTVRADPEVVPLGHVTNFTTPTPDPDFPGWIPTIETLSSCSYIIPMDYEYQGCQNLNGDDVGIINSACDICGTTPVFNCSVMTNPDFNLFAYGLANHLLWSDIPVKWIIKTKKLHNGYDIIDAPTVLVYPPRLAPSNLQTALGNAKNRSFSGGPFVVETMYTQYADPFMVNYTLTVGEVRVFIISTPINVDVRYTLLTRPYVAVLASSNEQFILEAVLMSAGFEKGLHWEEMTKEQARDKLGNGTCITLAMEPHFHACQDQDPTSNFTSNSAAFVSAARAVLNMGSNFYAMCGGIDTYEQCDNEDGTSCRFCAEEQFECQNCYVPGNPYDIPCRNNDTLDQHCKKVTVGALEFGSFRGAPLCEPNEDGYFYGRNNPLLTNKFCPNGFFMTENVVDSSFGGFNTPPHAFPQMNNHTTFFNLAPDIPFNQWLGDWDYESYSSIRFLTLWNSPADHILPEQQTKLRTSTWAHFTIAEENIQRDLNTKAGYPYGIYYAAHSKLSQFHGGKGGNIFYVAGHHYTADNRGYAGAGYLLSNATGSFGGSACVEAGSANLYNGVGEFMSGPATPKGGGCFNRPGRRMLLNAVMTPSNLTCNVPRTICSDGACTTTTVSLTVDACKAFGVCGGSGFKRNINIVSAATPSNSSTAACSAATIKCTCQLYFDCCGICGGDGTSCNTEINVLYADMLGQQVGQQVSVVINGVVQTGVQGIVAATPNPPQPPINLNAPPLSNSQVAQIIVVSPKILFTSLPDSLTVNTGTIQGTSVTFKLSGKTSDIQGVEDAIKDSIVSHLSSIGVTASEITVTYNNQTGLAVITVGSSTPTSPPSPTESPSGSLNYSTPTGPAASLLTNLTGSNTPHVENIILLPNQCVYYTYTVSPLIVSAILYVSIQTQNLDPTTTLNVYLMQNNYASPTNYICSSPQINDNNVYSFTWEHNEDGTGSYIGSSITIPATNTCTQKLVLQGNWYIAVCAGSSHVSFSFQASFVVGATSTNSQSPSDASTLSLFTGYLLVPVSMILLWFFINK